MPTARCSERNRPIGRRWRRRCREMSGPMPSCAVRLADHFIRWREHAPLPPSRARAFRAVASRRAPYIHRVRSAQLPPMKGCRRLPQVIGMHPATARRLGRSWYALAEHARAARASCTLPALSMCLSTHLALPSRSCLHTRSCAAAGDLARTGTRTRGRAEATQKGEK